MRFPCATRQHRLFSFISQNWRAKPLVSYRVIVELISATTTKTGLTAPVNSTLANTPAALSYQMSRWPYQHQTCRVPRRVELHHFTKPSSPKSRVNLVTGPK